MFLIYQNLTVYYLQSNNSKENKNKIIPANEKKIKKKSNVKLSVEKTNGDHISHRQEK